MAAPFRHIDGKMPLVIVLVWEGARKAPRGAFLVDSGMLQGFRRDASKWMTKGCVLRGDYGPLVNACRAPRGAFRRLVAVHQASL